MARTRDWRWVAKRTQPWADFAATALGWGLVLVFSGLTALSERSRIESLIFALAVGFITVVLLARRGLYSGRPTLPRTEEISRVLSSVVIAGLALAALSALFNWPVGARELALGILVAFVFRSLVRGVLRDVGSRFSSADTRVSVVVVGVGEEARDLVALIRDHPESRLRLLGVIGKEEVAQLNGLDGDWLGPAENMIEIMGSRNAEAAILTATGFRSPQFSRLTTELFSAGYDIHVSTGVNRLTNNRYDVRSLSHEPLVVLRHRRPTRWELAIKRVIDVVLASAGLVVAAPLMLLTALLIKLDDRGPVFFHSQRVGIDGRPFAMIKFRSMGVDAEAKKDALREKNQRDGPLFKMAGDPRITRVGRLIRETSIDELPQLLNVIRGDMSLVGPRPALLEEGEAFDDELRNRFLVPPGITGLWQVEARSNAAFSAYRRLDLHYVENWSLGLDLRIILATAEQLAISVITLPLRWIGGSAIDGVIDLSEPATEDAPTPSRGLTTPAAPLRQATADPSEVTSIDRVLVDLTDSAADSTSDRTSGQTVAN
ncbi:MAG: sugar transferase [Acidimicrobiales bacterium]